MMKHRISFLVSRTTDTLRKRALVGRSNQTTEQKTPLQNAALFQAAATLDEWTPGSVKMTGL